MQDKQEKSSFTNGPLEGGKKNSASCGIRPPPKEHAEARAWICERLSLAVWRCGRHKLDNQPDESSNGAFPLRSEALRGSRLTSERPDTTHLEFTHFLAARSWRGKDFSRPSPWALSRELAAERDTWKTVRLQDCLQADRTSSLALCLFPLRSTATLNSEKVERVIIEQRTSLAAGRSGVPPRQVVGRTGQVCAKLCSPWCAAVAPKEAPLAHPVCVPPPVVWLSRGAALDGWR